MVLSQASLSIGWPAEASHDLGIQHCSGSEFPLFSNYSLAEHPAGSYATAASIC